MPPDTGRKGTGDWRLETLCQLLPVHNPASLNQNQPAAFVMLGVAALELGDGPVARLAFKRAIKLGALNEPVLERIIERIEKLSSDDTRYLAVKSASGWMPFVLGIGLCLLLFLLVRWYRQDVL